MPVTIHRNDSRVRTYEIEDLQDGDAYECDGDIYIINKHHGAGVAGFSIDGNSILWEDNLHSAKLIPINLEITVC